MINQTVQLSASNLSGAIVETGAVEHLIDESFTDSTVNQLVTLSFAFASVKQVFLVASTDTHWYTNGAAGAGGQAFLLKAGIPIFLSATSAYLANPLTIDVTAFYFSCTVASHVQGFILTA